MKSMKLLSAKKSRPPKSSTPSRQAPIPIKSSQSVDSSELLQLRLENSDLRSRLDDALSHTDESKAELLVLLEEQTTQTNLLQSKCDELKRGFVEIDKERRALRQSADEAREDAKRHVDLTREECDARCSHLERHLNMREKEVEALAERTREQERRIETVMGENNEKQTKVEELEGELEELIGMVENGREDKRVLEGEYSKVMDLVQVREDELKEAKSVGEKLEQQVQEMKETLEMKEGQSQSAQDDLNKALKGKEQEVADLIQSQQDLGLEHQQAILALREEMKSEQSAMTSELHGKEQQVASLLQDLQLTKMENENALQTMQDELQNERNDFASQQRDMVELHQSEKAELIQTYQAQLHDKSNTIQTLTSEIETLKSNHATKLAEMESIIEQCKNGTQSIEKTYAESLTTNQKLQDELNNLHDLHQIAEEELKAANHLLENENADLAKELDATNTQLSDTNKILGDVKAEYTTLSAEHAALEERHSQLAEELDGAKVQLANTSQKICDLQTEHEKLQSDHSILQQDHLQLEQKISTLESEMEQMAVDHDESSTQKSQKISTVESELTEEKELSNKLRSQLRELNIRLKEDGSTWQKEKHILEQRLEDVREDLMVKEIEVHDLKTIMESEVGHHASELQSLRTEHAAQMMVIETRGADVVSDLEDAIEELEQKLAATKSEHDGVVSKMKAEMQSALASANAEKECVEHSLAAKEETIVEYKQRESKIQGDLKTSMLKLNEATQEKERLERSLAESAQKCKEQDGKITSLTAYAKERKTELARIKHMLDNSGREHEDAMAAVRSELEDARALHQREMTDLQRIVNDVRSELTAAQERLASDDGELTRAKATLSERTNLLRDMVNQTTAYQGDYEREHARAKQLDEAVGSYKKQLADARGMAQRLENEIHDKDTHYCDAIRNERQSRKAMEAELESSRKAMEDVLRKSSDMEKENSTLKDKVSRQEKYIGRLQDREKQNRRTSTMSTTGTSQVSSRSATSKIVRPSSAGARSPVRVAKERGVVTNKFRNGGVHDENERPNIIGRMGTVPQSPDETTSLLGKMN